MLDSESILLSTRALLAELATALFFFVFGACFGSFLNVVIYRLPRRMTLLGQSLCPSCRTTIELRDNIPVLAWIRLGGKCRHCQSPIDSRYWIVELAVASLAVGLAVSEIAFGGLNLPVNPAHYIGFAFNLFGPRPELLFWFAAHVGALTVLLALAWIQRDRQPTVWRLVVPVIVALIGAAIAFPSVRETGFYPAQPGVELMRSGYAVLAALVGLSFGYLIGSFHAQGQQEALAASMGVTAAALGIAPTACIAVAILPWVKQRGVFAVFWATLLHIVFWRALHWFEYLGDPDRRPHLFIFVALTIVVLTGVFRGRSSARPDSAH